MPELLVSEPRVAKAALVLAHGAGAPMDSAFLGQLTAQLVGRDLTVVRFNFAYMAERAKGRKRPPPKAEVLAAEFIECVALVRAAHPLIPIFIGGKSMGGRIASIVADELFASGAIKGCVCLGYPFFPPGKYN